jgi:hypothetical protein
MRGKIASHVGMMLSFAIFVTFIIFLYSITRPAINIGEDKSSILSYVETGIIKNTTANLTSVSLQIENPNPGQNCVVFQNFLFGMSESIDYYYNAIVKNESNAIQPTYENLYDLKVNRLEKKNTFFRIYFSPNFTKLTKSSISPCSDLKENIDYKIGSITIDRYMFEKKIIQVVDSYNQDYEKLKEELKIPVGNEFWFNFTKSDGTSMAPIQPDTQGANVFSNDIPIQYVDPNANIQSGFINIRVW